jgi:hypothetical protein
LLHTGFEFVVFALAELVVESLTKFLTQPFSEFKLVIFGLSVADRAAGTGHPID